MKNLKKLLFFILIILLVVQSCSLASADYLIFDSQNPENPNIIWDPWTGGEIGFFGRLPPEELVVPPSGPDGKTEQELKNYCGDKICQPEINETLETCPQDCGVVTFGESLSESLGFLKDYRTLIIIAFTILLASLFIGANKTKKRVRRRIGLPPDDDEEDEELPTNRK